MADASSAAGSSSGDGGGTGTGVPDARQLLAEHPEVGVMALAFCVLSVVTSLYGVTQHLRHYNKPDLQKQIVRITLVVPIYSIFSFLSLHFPDAAQYMDVTRDIYEAWVVHCFLQLVLEYAGGDSACVAAISEQPPMRHPWPLCKLRPMELNGTFLRRCKQGTLQFVVVKPIMAAISLVLLAAGQYSSTWYQWILLVVYNVSYTVALYALFLFYMATRGMLRAFSPVWKFLAVKAVVFMTYWQGLAVSLVPGLTAEQSELWNDGILSVEMFLFALLHLCAFSYREFEMRDGVPVPVSVLRNAREVLGVKDVAMDIYHHVVPSYHDYVLHKAYEESPQKTYKARTFLVGVGGRRKSALADSDALELGSKSSNGDLGSDMAAEDGMLGDDIAGSDGGFSPLVRGDSDASSFGGSGAVASGSHSDGGGDAKDSGAAAGAGGASRDSESPPRALPKAAARVQRAESSASRTRRRSISPAPASALSADVP